MSQLKLIHDLVEAGSDGFADRNLIGELQGPSVCMVEVISEILIYAEAIKSKRLPIQFGTRVGRS